MEQRVCDVFVSGGGISGLIAAIAFARAGFDVVCADPKLGDPLAPTGDLRTTALLQPARATLQKAGLWDALAPFATPLQVMRLAEASAESTLSHVADFDASEISDQPFGWNLPNTHLIQSLRHAAQAIPSLCLLPNGFAGMTTRLQHALVRLDTGTTLRARLVIAADGRNSAVRRALGVPVRRYRYGQRALVCAVHHDLPHDNISTEIHRRGGPFTLVPLPDIDGRPASSVVWMDDATQTRTRAALPAPDLNAALTKRSCSALGSLRVAGPVGHWPILSQLAGALTAQRSVLVAEAAHVVPPIGAQGLNMSLSDVQTLLEAATAAPHDLGSAEMLAGYARARLPDMRARVAGVDALNRASIAGAPGVLAMRRAGLNALHRVAPLRRAAMAAGLGHHPAATHKSRLPG